MMLSVPLSQRPSYGLANLTSTAGSNGHPNGQQYYLCLPMRAALYTHPLACSSRIRLRRLLITEHNVEQRPGPADVHEYEPNSSPETPGYRACKHFNGPYYIALPERCLLLSSTRTGHCTHLLHSQFVINHLLLCEIIIALLPQSKHLQKKRTCCVANFPTQFPARLLSPCPQ